MRKNILLPSPQSHPRQTGVCTQQVYKQGPFISLFSKSCLSTALLEPRGALTQMPMGLGAGWAPEPGPASSQHQEIHRERAAGLLGLSEGQQKRGRTRDGDGARSWTQPCIKHYQTEKKLRIITWATPGEEARPILNPRCVLGKAKYVLVSKHVSKPNFIIICTPYLQQPARR